MNARFDQGTGSECRRALVPETDGKRFSFAITTGLSPYNAFVIGKILEAGLSPSCILVQNDLGVERERRARSSRLTGYAKRLLFRGWLSVLNRLLCASAVQDWPELGACFLRYRNRVEYLRRRLAEHSPGTELSFCSVNTDPRVLELLRQADLLLVLGGKILTAEVFTAPRLGAVNLHNTLLPHFRGMGPIECIINHYQCYSEAGITLHRVAAGMDTGDIIAQARVPTYPGEHPEHLRVRVFEVGYRLVTTSLRALAAGDAMSSRPQDHSQATYLKHFAPTFWPFWRVVYYTHWGYRRNLPPRAAGSGTTDQDRPLCSE